MNNIPMTKYIQIVLIFGSGLNYKQLTLQRNRKYFIDLIEKNWGKDSEVNFDTPQSEGNLLVRFNLKTLVGYWIEDLPDPLPAIPVTPDPDKELYRRFLKKLMATLDQGEEWKG